jgi:L-fucose isomerase-like protein
MKRRDFIIKTGCGTATMLLHPRLTSMLNIGTEHFSNISALNTRLKVKFVINGMIHEGAWEGSCRVGSLQTLTYEAEKAALDKKYDDFRKDINNLQFPPEIEILEPFKSYEWVEKGNPEIMYPEENLTKLADDDLNTDVYVIKGDGLPQFPGLIIAERFRKPVILASTPGWGIDMAAGIRNIGLEGHYVQNDDQLKDLLKLMFVRKAFSRTKLLIVTNFPKSVPKGVVSSLTDLEILREKYRMNYHYVDYNEFFKVMDDMEGDNNSFKTAHEISKKLLDGAKSNNMSLENIINSVRFYLTTQYFLEKYSCNAFTIECFELCSSLNPWNRKFTPCLCHALLKDMGYPSACEADINVLLSMAVQMYLSGKAVYMGNPDIDINNNTLTVHHSVASLKMMGFDQPETGYDIASFATSGFGATLRHDFKENINKVMTVGRFSPSGKEMLITKGNIIDGNTTGCGCAQNVTLQIPDGKEFLEKQQDYGHHLSLVYGDYCKQIIDLGKIMGFKVNAVL